MIKIILALASALCLTQTVNASASISITPMNTPEQDSISAAEYGSHWFGRLEVNTRAIARFTLTNTGNEPMDYVSTNIWGMFFDAYHNCNVKLMPGQKCRFDITYWPAFEGHHTGDFVMQFKQDMVQIRVWGEAFKRP